MQRRQRPPTAVSSCMHSTRSEEVGRRRSDTISWGHCYQKLGTLTVDPRNRMMIDKHWFADESLTGLQKCNPGNVEIETGKSMQVRQTWVTLRAVFCIPVCSHPMAQILSAVSHVRRLQVHFSVSLKSLFPTVMVETGAGYNVGRCVRSRFCPLQNFDAA